MKCQQHKLENHETESMVLFSFMDTLYALLIVRKLFLYAAALIIIQEEEMWPGDALDKLAHSPPGAIHYVL